VLTDSHSDVVIKWQILTAGLNGISAGQFSVLLVHVVSSGTGVVTEPDTEVLNGLGLLFEDLQYPETSK
jgi:hypothetical protein